MAAYRLQDVLDYFAGVGRATAEDLLSWLFQELAQGNADLVEECKQLLHAQSPIKGSSAGRESASPWHDKARKELKELLNLASEQRKLRVQRATGRFSNPHLVDLLLEESRRRLGDDPHEAVELADLAHGVAFRIPESFGSTSLFAALARTAAFRGHARAVAGDLKGGQESIDMALKTLRAHCPQDLALKAEILGRKAAVLQHQASYLESERVLGEVVALYTTLGNHHEVGRALLEKAAGLYYQGLLTESLVAVRRAEPLLDTAAEPYLALVAADLLAHILCAQGSLKEAEDVLEANHDLIRQFPQPRVQLRVRWLLGRIAGGKGEMEEAELILIEVKTEFLKRGIGYDAALVSLDLAEVYAKQARTADLKQLAREIIPIFHAQDVHTEAARALGYVVEAAFQEQLTVELILAAGSYLQRARFNSALCFRAE